MYVASKRAAHGEHAEAYVTFIHYALYKLSNIRNPVLLEANSVTTVPER